MRYKNVIKILIFMLLIGAACLSTTIPVTSADHSPFFSRTMDTLWSGPWRGFHYYQPAQPTIYDLHGFVITGGVRIMENTALVSPTIGTTPDSTVILNTESSTLREVEMWVFDDEGSRAHDSVEAPISGVFEIPRSTTRGLVYPGEPNPIRLRDWSMAHATGTVKVEPDDTSTVNLTFKRLIPHSLYTIWQFNMGEDKTDGPFGGIPNVFVTDAQGNAEFERYLPYNPIGFISHLVVVYHSDHSVYGGVPSPSSGGLIHHGHVRIDFPPAPYTFSPFQSMLFQSFPFLFPLVGDIQFPSFLSYPAAPPCNVSTPGVVNTFQSEAEQALNAANLAVGSITFEYSDIVREGKVISQSPATGRSVPLNSDVALVISLGPHPSVALELIAHSLVSPVGIVSPDDGTGRLFIVDRVGLIKILMPNGVMLLEPFLDLRDKMVELRPTYDERGLLGLVFHPDFKTNNRFFVHYSAPLSDALPEHSEWDHTSHIAEFMVSVEDANKADAASEKILLQVDQPERNHNGGTIVFGPDDGYLYITLGDGGGANDNRPTHPEIGNGQDRSTLLGSILRIDVDSETLPYAYGIPEDNPFVGMDDRDEIFAYGLRNPFFLSFDKEGGHDLFVGDVGQNRWEEVNIITSGNNYGWNIKEGIDCFDPDNPDVALDTCPETGAHGEPLIDPIITYKNAHVPGGIGSAVIGGYVYRGNFFAGFYGKYIFGDWSTSFSVTDGTLFIATPPLSEEQMWSMEELLIATGMDARLGESVIAFGQDSQGELYVLTTQSIGPSGETGKVYRIVPPDGSVPFVNVLDQELDTAHEVTIAVVAYNAPGWIVIHKNEALGPIIGHAPIVPGINLDVLVTLDEDAEHEQILHAMLHKDEGIIGEYEFPGPDGPIVDLTGKVIVHPFRVNVPASHMATMVPDLVGMVQSDAEGKTQEHNLILGSITQAYSDMVPTGTVISQDPAAGTSVPEGSSINLVISEGPLATVTFSSDVQPIFTANCTTGCHSGRGVAEFLSLTAGTAYDNLVNKPATRSSGTRVIPFNASESVLYRRIIGDRLGKMPPGAAALSQENQSAIQIWIDEGALNN